MSETASPRRKTLLEGLRDPDPSVRATASEALDRLEVLAGLPGLMQQIASLDKAGWVSLLRSMEGLRDESCLRLAIGALGHPEEDVRLAALEFAGSFSDWRGTSPVARRLSDKSPLVRARAAKVLGRLGDRRAGEALVPLTADPDPRVAAEAATALGLLGHAAAEERLLALAKHEVPEVRSAAITALGRIPLGSAGP